MSDSEDATADAAVSEDDVEDVSDDVEASGREEEETADEVEALEARIEELEAERDELEARLKRTAADFENYKKRQAKQREQLKTAANERIVTRLLDVRDNLQRAIDQEEAETESLREGVKLTLAEFDRVLDAEDVEEISPTPGDEVDPQRHEVMLQMNGEQPAGHIEEIYQPGYEMAGKVLRAAQVAVSKDEPETGGE